ncbi:MAG TPA: MFS transporter [Steroidobacteraceae bacterium]|nr:MFS transporter [Steroidobacteraceae bacterium]
MRPLLTIFFICAVDVLGFGVIVPLVPYMADRFGAAPWLITAILGSYSLCQLIAAPLWGRLSDRYGRRPILIIGMAGACLSYLLLGFAPGLSWLLLSRMLSGFMAGNISAAMAYAADVSLPEHRARALGTVGAAIAVGFMIGPALGGVLVGNDVRSASFLLPALVSAALSIVAMVLVAVLLRESVGAAERQANRGRAVPATVLHTLAARPALRWLVLAGVLVTFSQSTLESIVALWGLKRFGVGPRSIGLILFGLAAITVAMQGGLVRVLAPRFGEQRLAIGGIAAYVGGLALAGLAPTLLTAIGGLALCGVGSGAFSPSASALASRQADAGNRGVVMGTYQAGASLARVLGPFSSGFIFGRFGPGAPFLVGALVTLQALWCMLAARRASIRDAQQ